MTDQEKVNHYNAISEIRRTIGGWFGDADLIFAGHPLDEGRAKEARKLAIENNVTKKEIIELSLGFLYGKNCIKEHTDEQIKKIDKFFKSLN